MINVNVSVKSIIREKKIVVAILANITVKIGDIQKV